MTIHKKFLLCSFVVALALAGCGAQEETYTENKKGLEAVSEAVDTIQADFPDNADAKGWLLFPGTEIDNVVMQAADNSYYLRRDEKGAYSIWGCYFADYEADLTASGPSRNTVIYGHSSLDDETEGKKFTELKKLNLFDFADEHRCFYFSTRDASYVAEIFSVGYWPDSAQYLYADPTDAAFEDLLEEAKAHSIYNYPVDPGLDDHIITLSTCTGNDEERVVVMAVLHPENSSDIGAGELTVNETPKGA